jgi:hypothetical protein
MKNKILIFLLLFSFSAMSTEMEQAKKYYRARDYEKAYRIFHNLAEKGDPEAQLCVAIFLFKKHVSDPAALPVLYWIEKSASQKYAPAMAALSAHYLDKGEWDKGIKLMEEAAHLNSGLAQYHLGYYYLGFFGKKRDKKLAVEWLKKAVSNPDHQGRRNAALLLGVLYQMEGETSQDMENAIIYFQIAADSKDPNAPFILFELFFTEGEFPSRNIVKAKDFFQLALKRKNTEALVLAGVLAQKKGKSELAAQYFDQAERKKVDIPATIKRYDHIIKDKDFEKIMDL